MTPNPLTAEDLAAIRQRLADATPGPWGVDDRIRCLAVVAPALADSPGLGADYPGVVAFWSGHSSTDDPCGPWDDAGRTRRDRDAVLISNAPTDLTRLLTDLDRLRAAARGILTLTGDETMGDADTAWSELAEAIGVEDSRTRGAPNAK